MFAWLSGAEPYHKQIGFVTTDADARKAIEDHALGLPDGYEWPESDEGVAWRWDGEGVYLIALNKNPALSLGRMTGLVAHECMHVVQYLWEDIGEEAPGVEAEAYLIGFLVEQIFDILEVHK